MDKIVNSKSHNSRTVLTDDTRTFVELINAYREIKNKQPDEPDKKNLAESVK